MRVGIVEQVLDAQQDLLDGDGGLPALVLVQDAETHSARGEDVGVEERWRKLALRRLAWVFFGEDHAKLVEAAFPWRLFGSEQVK